MPIRGDPQHRRYPDIPVAVSAKGLSSIDYKPAGAMRSKDAAEAAPEPPVQVSKPCSRA
ncbi:hypothetical protein D3C85_747550 [compost metagenome]